MSRDKEMDLCLADMYGWEHGDGVVFFDTLSSCTMMGNKLQRRRITVRK